MANQKRVLLTSLDTLTFYDGEHTTFRRTGPVPQLQCKGQPCKRYKPDVIQCHNAGGSGTNVQWKCEADLPDSIKLGRTEVSCEGYRSAEDPYVLEGSCGLTYTLKDSGFSSTRATRDVMSLEACLFWALFAVVGLFIIYPFLRSLLSPALRPLSRYTPRWLGGTGGGGGGGGGSGGGWGWGNRPGPRFWGGGRPGDPPPPYSPRNTPPSKSSSNDNESWRPGFWSGLAAGTAAMHLFGNRQQRQRPYDFDQSPFASRPYGFGGGGLFGGSSINTPRRTATYRGQGSSRDMDDSNNLGAFRSSTGFGGTRNR